MPTTPRPKLKAAPTGSGKPRATAESSGEKQTSGQSPSASSPRRTPKNNQLRENVQRFYVMIGTILLPFGRFIPQLAPLGDSLKYFADEAADAWMDVAEKDPKIKAYLESWTGASTWGQLVGVHFSIIMRMTATQQQQKKEEPMSTPEQDPIAFAKAMGLSDEEISKAFEMAEGIVSDRPSEPSVDEVKEHEKIKDEISNLKTRSGIVSPDQLGVQNDGQDEYSGPLNTGGIK